AGESMTAAPVRTQRFQFPAAPSDARAVYAPYDGMEIPEVIESLAGRLYVIPLRREQKELFARSLGGESAGSEVFTAADWPVERLQGTLHLMMSAAEFQLC